MFKMIKVGIYFTALGVLVYFITPELFHTLSKELGDAGNNILSGIKTSIGQYIKEKAVEGVKELPSNLYKGIMAQPPERF